MNTDKFYKQILECVKHTNMVMEMSYEGNIGLIEMAKFFQIANPEEVKQFEQLMAINDLPNAWKLIQKVVGVRLHGLPEPPAV